MNMNMNVFGAGNSFFNNAGNDLKKFGSKGFPEAGKRNDINNPVVKWMDKLQNEAPVNEVRLSSENAVSKTNEEGLSKRAQEYLARLRENNSDFDFMIGNSGDDLTSMVNSSNKEFSVILSNSEIERMAADEEYASDKLRTIENVVEMSKRINEQFGFESALDAAQGGGNTLSKFGVAIGDDGNVTLFAELEKSSQKQREQLDSVLGNDGANKADKLNPYAKPDENSVKKTTIQAGSEEELLEKLNTIEWKDVPSKASAPGERLNFTV